MTWNVTSDLGRTLATALAVLTVSSLIQVSLPAPSAATPTTPSTPGSTATPASTTEVSAVPQLVVKVRSGSGCTIAQLAASYQLTVDDGGLASRSIYRAHSNQPQYQTDAASLKKLVDRMRGDQCVAYVETDNALTLSDEQFHSWTPDGLESSTAAEWASQPARALLQLDQAHLRSTGTGITVAILDTGVDAQQEVLAGQVLAGYDYIDDDADSSDSTGAAGPVDTDRDGRYDEAIGHGTFVAGMVAMVAPDAQILPLRALDSDGVGTVFSVAEALFDAVAAGAQVINLSFGTAAKVDSPVLRQALEAVKRAKIIVVAAAGNDATTAPQYPASVSEVFSVGATDISGSSLTDFSNRGPWVDVATIGTDLVGPQPGGHYARWSGTSLSTPLVSGQLALVLAAVSGRKDPGKRAAEAMTRTCRRLDKLKSGTIDLTASLDYLQRR